jgi:hypothetical protein
MCRSEAFEQKRRDAPHSKGFARFKRREIRANIWSAAHSAAFASPFIGSF